MTQCIFYITVSSDVEFRFWNVFSPFFSKLAYALHIPKIYIRLLFVFPLLLECHFGSESSSPLASNEYLS